MRKILIALLLLVPFVAEAQTTGGVPSYAEDTPHVSGQKGLMPLCRRSDAAASSTATDGDYGTFNCDADGKLWVAGITGGGDATAANQVIGNNSLSSIDGKITACNTGSVTVVSMPAVTVSAPALSEATFAAITVVGFASIGAAYASAVNLPDDTKVVNLSNQTNGDVYVSMDGGANDTFHMKAGDEKLLNLAGSYLKSTADVQLKDGISASTSGTFFVSSYK